ncbi:MAG: high-potential iron-sulfur protein [Steroidobacteraceae bacterium]|nr:high-potential iron-sulfur protein [Steroidobacteraceae bacterium]
MRYAISRRDLMKRALVAGTLAPALGLVGKNLRAAELTPLDPNDPAAKSLGFVTDASKVDAKANSTFKPGQHCGTCLQYQGKPSDATAACTIFAGHSVPAKGWCKVWAQRPG